MGQQGRWCDAHAGPAGSSAPPASFAPSVPAAMKAHTKYLWFHTKKRQEFPDVAAEGPSAASAAGMAGCLVRVAAAPFPASVLVTKPEWGLWRDTVRGWENTGAPGDPGRCRHNETGEDNAAAHLRSLTVGHEVIVPLTKGALDLGPWQRVFYGEWDGQRRKRLIIKVLGE